MFHNTWNMNIRWLISLALLLTLVIPVWAGGDTGCGCSSSSYCDCTSTPSNPQPCNNETDACSAAGCQGSDCASEGGCGDVCVNASNNTTPCGGSGTCPTAFCQGYGCDCGNGSALFCYNTDSTCDDWRCGHGSGSPSGSGSYSLLTGGMILASPAPAGTLPPPPPGTVYCACPTPGVVGGMYLPTKM